MDVLGLKEPTDSLVDLISGIMHKFKKDELSAARLFIRYYRDGKYGLFILDDVELIVCTKNTLPFTTKVLLRFIPSYCAS